MTKLTYSPRPRLGMLRGAVITAYAAGALSFAANVAIAQDATVLEEYDAATIVSSVGEIDITLGDVIAARQGLPAQLQGLPEDQLFDGLIEQLVQRALFAGAATNAGLEDDADVRRQIASARREILAGAYIASKIEPQLTEEALQARYDQEIANAPSSEEVRARHILVEKEAKAADLKRQLDDGADFETLAKENSTGPSGPNGGDLGFFQHGQMVPEFEEAAFALEAGQVSDPVKTNFGWHVIKLEERRQSEPPSLDQVREQVRQLLAAELAEAEIEALTTSGGVTRPDAMPPASAVRDDALLR